LGGSLSNRKRVKDQDKWSEMTVRGAEVGAGAGATVATALYSVSRDVLGGKQEGNAEQDQIGKTLPWVKFTRRRRGEPISGGGVIKEAWGRGR